MPQHFYSAPPWKVDVDNNQIRASRRVVGICSGDKLNCLFTIPQDEGVSRYPRGVDRFTYEKRVRGAVLDNNNQA
jgi:hypothetical protein